MVSRIVLKMYVYMGPMAVVMVYIYMQPIAAVVMLYAALHPYILALTSGGGGFLEKTANLLKCILHICPPGGGV